MELKPVTFKTKCDNGACQRLAEYTFLRKDTPRELSLCLCSECIEEILSLYIENGTKGAKKTRQRR